MKKFLFTFMATIFIVMQGYSQTLLNESFEGAAFPPLNWITQNTRGPATLWENTTDFAHTGSVCAFVSYNADGTTNYLITP
ncbi:MAG: hypothetical protein PHG98_06795, partial [Bacteroidales bacterium]|nr:hypothetical protein [Bacteroidales bacterium]